MNTKARALIVDDEIYIQQILSATLEDAGFQCVAVGTVDAAFAELGTQGFDLAFTDIMMPGRSATELLELVKGAYPDIVIIIITAHDAASTAIDMIRKGAYDYIVKPFNLEQVVIAANRALEKRRLEIAAREYHRYLEESAEVRAAETRRLFYAVTQVLVRLLEIKAPFSIGHSQRVAEMSRYVARELRMTDDGIHKVYLAGLLHDIGIITAADLLLNKQGPLTPEELQEMRARGTLAEDVLRPILEDDEVLKHIRHRSERYDGEGHPDRLKGKIIPLGARIISVVEAFDAMTRPRPYRRPLAPEEAIDELRRCSGTQFDHQVVTVFAELYDQRFRHFYTAAVRRT